MYEVKRSENNTFFVTNELGKTTEFAYEPDYKEVYAVHGDASGFSYNEVAEVILPLISENE